MMSHGLGHTFLCALSSYILHCAITADAQTPVFHPVPPLGSGVYTSEVTSASIGFAGVANVHNVALSGSQDLAILIDPASSLQPEVRLQTESGDLLASAQAVGAGESLFLQGVTLNATDAYEVRVGGSSGTVGSYDIQFVVNAVMEEESLNVGANNDRASAQDLDVIAREVLFDDDLVWRSAVLGHADFLTQKD